MDFFVYSFSFSDSPRNSKLSRFKYENLPIVKISIKFSPFDSRRDSRLDAQKQKTVNGLRSLVLQSLLDAVTVSRCLLLSINRPLVGPEII